MPKLKLPRTMGCWFALLGVLPHCAAQLDQFPPVHAAHVQSADTSAQSLSPAESLLIGPGDMLHVQVCDTPQLEQRPRVDDEGNIALLFLTKLKVRGMTPSEAADLIQTAMLSQGLMKHPQVAVSVDQYATQAVSVLGQVDKPGAYPIQTPVSILAVISMAGGLTSVADRNILVRRHGEKRHQESFLLANAPSSDFMTDLTIYPGDTVIVPRVSFVYVLGDVGRPGGYPMATGDAPSTVLTLLAQAGAANKSAILSSAKILRKSNTGYTVLPIDLARLQRGTSADVALEPEDVIYVPFSYAKNFVLNAAAMATSVASATIFLP